MRRLHLFEFTDLKWFPQVLRDAETAYLATTYRLLRAIPRRWAELIATTFAESEKPEILDLCSGAGGPVPLILEELDALGYHVTARLTDLYPNPNAGSRPEYDQCSRIRRCDARAPRSPGRADAVRRVSPFPPPHRQSDPDGRVRAAPADLRVGVVAVRGGLPYLIGRRVSQSATARKHES